MIISVRGADKALEHQEADAGADKQKDRSRSVRAARCQHEERLLPAPSFTQGVQRKPC
ncbi:hypothetical protein ABEV00_04960 [Paenibacillus thiaminolyticus]|uniref:hypothetical protein n=1 Tax=Paenibacillus thiaminolyticus TaxID=49283 RepID=UPI003D2DCDC8